MSSFASVSQLLCCAFGIRHHGGMHNNQFLGFSLSVTHSLTKSQQPNKNRKIIFFESIRWREKIQKFHRGTSGRFCSLSVRLLRCGYGTMWTMTGRSVQVGKLNCRPSQCVRMGECVWMGNDNRCPRRILWSHKRHNQTVCISLPLPLSVQ